MNKYIKQFAEQKIESLGLAYAHNYFAKEQQLTTGEPDKTKLDAAEFNMKEAEKQIKWYKNFTKAKK